MAKPIKFDDGSDSEGLQALFDSIAADAPPALPAPARAGSSGDSDELQALFDRVVGEHADDRAGSGAAESAEWGGSRFGRTRRRGAGQPQVDDILESLGF